MTVLAALLLIIADQATKAWAQAALVPPGQSTTLIPGALRLTYVENTGAAFGLLRGVDLRFGPVHVDGTLVLGLLSLAVSIWLALHLLRRGREHGVWMRIVLTLVLAGAAGNMIDRLRLGYVIDFVHFQVGWFDFPVFNLADAMISVGAALIVLTSLFGGAARRSTG